MIAKQEAFQELKEYADNLLAQTPEVEQAVAVETAAGNRYGFVSRNILAGDHQEEAAFAKMLAEKGETQLRYLVCQWQGGSLDVISRAFWHILTTMDPKNLDTEILLQGFDSEIVKPLRSLQPPRKE